MGTAAGGSGAPLIENRGISVRATQLEIADGALYADYGKSPYFAPDGAPTDVPEPHGISGGPLFAVRAGRRGLLGLARSIDRDRKMERFEPIANAVRLLLQVDDADLRHAAEAVLSRIVG